MININQLIDWYEISPNSCIHEDLASPEDLITKWENKISDGWYGFDLPNIPQPWVDILDEVLSYLQSTNPDFQIQQIKVKFGSIRIYISGIMEDSQFITEQLLNLEEKLFDRRLLY